MLRTIWWTCFKLCFRLFNLAFLLPSSRIASTATPTTTAMMPTGEGRSLNQHTYMYSVKIFPLLTIYCLNCTAHFFSDISKIFVHLGSQLAPVWAWCLWKPGSKSGVCPPTVQKIAVVLAATNINHKVLHSPPVILNQRTRTGWRFSHLCLPLYAILLKYLLFKANVKSL